MLDGRSTYHGEPYLSRLVVNFQFEGLGTVFATDTAGDGAILFILEQKYGSSLCYSILVLIETCKTGISIT